MELAVSIVSWRIDSPGVGTEMGPYYASMCTELGWAPDADLLASFTCVVHLALAMDMFLLGFRWDSHWASRGCCAARSGRRTRRS